MDFKKLLCAAASLAMAASIFTGCGKSEESSVSKAESSAASEIALDENAEAAEKLLTDLSGTYHELWPVILADDYRQTWLAMTVLPCGLPRQTPKVHLKRCPLW